MGKNVCRYGFPLPPMSQTQILEPLDSDYPKDMLKNHHNNLQKIHAVLKSLVKDEDMPFCQFLAKCGVSEDTYILAIRSGLKRKQVFLKRQVKDVRVNAHNMDILRIWQANTDLQFALDPWAVCVYISSYMMKSQRGMSNLLRQACEEARAGNHTVRQRMRIISNKFLNHCEVSAQEAVYLLLQMPLVQASRDVIFINTSPPEQRVFILKPKEQLQGLPDDSTDVTCSGLPEKYANRPKVLETVSLAEFAAFFQEHVYRKTTTKEDDFESDQVDLTVENIEPGIKIPMPNGNYLVKRRIPKVIRYVHFSKEKDPELFYRELLMLHTAWRNEEDLKGNSGGSYEQEFLSKETEITDATKRFDQCGDDLYKAVMEVDEETVLEAIDGIAPTSRQAEEDTNAETCDAAEHSIIFPSKPEHKTYDTGIDMGIGSNVHVEAIINNRLSDEDYHDLAINLNKEQQSFFYHVIHTVKTKTTSFHVFLTGGAGVGKSHLLKCLCQALYRYYDTTCGENPDEIKVVVGAPTAKAAFGVRGHTLHSLFALPANQSLAEYHKLDHSTLNTLRCRYAKLQILIIDEISMVGVNMFNFINSRLQEIFATSQPFGGISLLVVGDLFQLRPVQDSWIFKTSDKGYGPIASNTWQDLVGLFELKTIMRQKDDATYAELLNRVREGKQIESDLTTLQSKVKEAKTSFNLSDVLHLFTTNDKVNEHNDFYLQALQTQGCMSLAVDYTIGDVTPSAKLAVLEVTMNLPPQKTQNLLQQLQIKMSAHYLLVVNIDTTDGLTNGATGVLKHFDSANGKPHTIWIHFTDPSIGGKARQQYKTLFKTHIDRSWTPIFTVDRQFQVGKYRNIKVVRRQFPLKPAAAMTIHKAQGMSIPEVAVSFQGRVQTHMVYVALSRVTSLSGLHLLDLDSKKITVDKLVVQEMERLRQHSLITTLPEDPSSASNKVICLNTRSLHKHITSVRSHSSLLAADILIMQETWALRSDSADYYKLEGFDMPMQCFTQETKDRRPHDGIFIYLKSHIEIHSLTNVHDKNGQAVHLNLSSPTESFEVLAVYRRPNTPLTGFFNLVNQLPLGEKTLISIGDFNVDQLKPSSDLVKLQKFMSLSGLKATPPSETTDYHSSLDHIYVSNLSARTGVIETFWSDHKAVWISV